ncbi:MAG: hypothetical protein RL637_1487 [Pseudomonadota bacterium]|jgi:hypothetical protein
MITYQTDFYSWTQQQAALLKARKFDELDFDNLIDEIESMGASERKELDSCLIELLLHLLKWQYQPKRKGSSWEVSIAKQRDGIEKILRDNPSLKYQLDKRVADCYGYARRYAAIETQLPKSRFPEECPYSLEQLFNESFMPDSE